MTRSAAATRCCASSKRTCSSLGTPPPSPLAGLDPAIHVFFPFFACQRRGPAGQARGRGLFLAVLRPHGPSRRLLRLAVSSGPVAAATGGDGDLLLLLAGRAGDRSVGAGRRSIWPFHPVCRLGE